MAWFRFFPGMTSLSVELQQFVGDAKGYFEAGDHLSGQIVGSGAAVPVGSHHPDYPPPLAEPTVIEGAEVVPAPDVGEGQVNLPDGDAPAEGDPAPGDNPAAAEPNAPANDPRAGAAGNRMSLAGGDLTTLAAVKGYINSAPSDQVLSGLITRISRMMLSAMNRPLLVPRLYAEQFDGTGTNQLVLPNWPVLSISSLAISGAAVPLALQPTAPGFFNAPFGYRFQPWNGMPPGDPAAVQLVGSWYRYGFQNVLFSYTAGYQVTGEVPNAAVYPPLVPWGSWATDQGVTYATSGAALTPTTGSTMPSAGSYIPPAPAGTSPTYNYLFNSTDVSSGILINYGYIPADVEQGAIEYVSERASYRNRVGMRSQSLAGQEVMSYDLSGVTRFVQMTLAPYISVIPPATGAAV